MKSYLKIVNISYKLVVFRFQKPSHMQYNKGAEVPTGTCILKLFIAILEWILGI